MGRLANLADTLDLGMIRGQDQDQTFVLVGLICRLFIFSLWSGE